MSDKRPMRAPIFAASLMLCAVPTACGPRLNLTAPASPCMKILLASGLLDPTPLPSAALIDGTAGGLGAHDVAAVGQIVKGNIDKKTAANLGSSCDAEWAASLKAARPHKFLGLF